MFLLRTVPRKDYTCFNSPLNPLISDQTLRLFVSFFFLGVGVEDGKKNREPLQVSATHFNVPQVTSSIVPQSL